MASGHEEIKLTEVREFTVEEKSILNKMTSVNFQGRDIIKKQLKSAKVNGYCTCGCKSISIEVDENVEKFPSNLRVPVEMMVNGSDGIPIIFFLHITKGYVSELEIFKADSSQIDEAIDVSNASITPIV